MQQQAQIQLPVMVSWGRVVFAAQALLGFDASAYEPGKPDRCITTYLAGPHEIELYDTDADAFKAWWDQVTGQNRIQAPPPGLKLST
jgi:hypothetical protein